MNGHIIKKCAIFLDGTPESWTVTDIVFHFDRPMEIEQPVSLVALRTTSPGVRKVLIDGVPYLTTREDPGLYGFDPIPKCERGHVVEITDGTIEDELACKPA